MSAATLKNEKQNSMISKNAKQDDNEKYEIKIVWRNVIAFIYLHIGAFYGVYLMFTSAKVLTSIFAIWAYTYSGLGVTAGAHRLWTHKAYKAKWPLKLYLMILDTLAFQDCVIDWAKDHRVHHKYTDTNADPYNAKRGFFFSHIGWLLIRKHPDVKKKGREIDISDLLAEPILVFQKKYYLILMPLICFILPTMFPVYMWGETWRNSFFVGTILRYQFQLHMAWCVNSVAHIWGTRPYDKHQSPVENLFVGIFAGGEGWHNYHHAFPWDYRASEIGKINLVRNHIDLWTKMGLAYDLKTASPDLIRSVIKNKGDGSFSIYNEVEDPEKIK